MLSIIPRGACFSRALPGAGLVEMPWPYASVSIVDVDVDEDVD